MKQDNVTIKDNKLTIILQLSGETTLPVSNKCLMETSIYNVRNLYII